MTAVTAIDWDAWRAAYHDMSFADHQTFNAECLRLHPDQRSWNAAACATFLAEREPKTVVEVGGWDGALASMVIDLLPMIGSWTNYDITPGIPQECADARYEYVVLDDWPWRMKVNADALIASHVFEHMTMYQIELLVGNWDVRSVYIDCPIGTAGSSWRGYNGSHILGVGSVELLSRLSSHGYAVTPYADTIWFLDRMTP